MNAVLWFIGGHGGTPTDLWGGFISCLGFVGALAAIYKKHKCHEPRCPRLQMHHVAGTPYIVCRKHHPTVPTRLEKGEIGRAHDRAQVIARALSHRPAPAPEPAPRGRKR